MQHFATIIISFFKELALHWRLYSTKLSRNNIEKIENYLNKMKVSFVHWNFIFEEFATLPMRVGLIIHIYFVYDFK